VPENPLADENRRLSILAQRMGPRTEKPCEPDAKQPAATTSSESSAHPAG
jgi:hypothetical protein